MASGAIDFSTAAPTLTHRALVELVQRGKGLTLNPTLTQTQTQALTRRD